MLRINEKTLELIGTAFYGRNWKTELAADLFVNRRTIYKWLNGERVTEDVERRIRKLAADRIEMYMRIIEASDAINADLQNALNYFRGIPTDQLYNMDTGNCSFGQQLAHQQEVEWRRRGGAATPAVGENGDWEPETIPMTLEPASAPTDPFLAARTRRILAGELEWDDELKDYREVTQPETIPMTLEPESAHSLKGLFAELDAREAEQAPQPIDTTLSPEDRQAWCDHFASMSAADLLATDDRNMSPSVWAAWEEEKDRREERGELIYVGDELRIAKNRID